jgi:phospholipase C
LTRNKTAVRKQFVEKDIPTYFAYARQFVVCDHYFTDVAGPSTPNHLMLIAAASPIIALIKEVQVSSPGGKFVLVREEVPEPIGLRGVCHN